MPTKAFPSPFSVALATPREPCGADIRPTVVA